MLHYGKTGKHRENIQAQQMFLFSLRLAVPLYYLCGIFVLEIKLFILVSRKKSRP